MYKGYGLLGLRFLFIASTENL